MLILCEFEDTLSNLVSRRYIALLPYRCTFMYFHVHKTPFVKNVVANVGHVNNILGLCLKCPADTLRKNCQVTKAHIRSGQMMDRARYTYSFLSSFSQVKELVKILHRETEILNLG